MTVAMAESYATCQALARRHGTTYYWSTYGLPTAKRPAVWAMYAFCRVADDIVDESATTPLPERAAALRAFGERFFADLDVGTSDHPVLAAVVDTVLRFGHDPECFRRFLRAMTMDLSVSRYETYGDLLGYMDGSAAVIGEMMLPILEPISTAAFTHARDLGLAFQLTNFLRDVDEDLDRGRVYLPTADLAFFDADPERRVVDDEWRALMRFEIERCRSLYRSADRGIAMLPPASARCVRAARVLYAAILDRIEDTDYDVFHARAVVPTWRKVAAAAAAYRPRG